MESPRLPKSRDETAAEAFARLDERVEALDGRIALMVRAVEHMAAERFEVEIPDYGSTLEKTNAWLSGIYQRLEKIEEAPALDITPEHMGARIAAAAHKAREEDKAEVGRVRQNQIDAIQALRQIIGHARSRDVQRAHILYSIGGGILAGCLLWSLLPGMIARTMPESWHWPERIARRTVGEPSLWEAGARMIRAESPRAWEFVIEAAEIRRQNQEAFDACEKKADKARKAVRCTINIENSRS